MCNASKVAIIICTMKSVELPIVPSKSRITILYMKIGKFRILGILGIIRIIRIIRILRILGILGILGK